MYNISYISQYQGTYIRYAGVFYMVEVYYVELYTDVVTNYFLANCNIWKQRSTEFSLEYGYGSGGFEMTEGQPRKSL